MVSRPAVLFPLQHISKDPCVLTNVLFIFPLFLFFLNKIKLVAYYTSTAI